MRVTATDVVSTSYFVATAAVELGYFADEGVDAEFIFPKGDASQALRDGEIDFYAASPYVALMAFPEWQGGKLLCALSQDAYWTLAMRKDLGAARGDVNAVKGKRILAGAGPGIALKQMLLAAGIDMERDQVQMVAPPWGPDPSGNLARQGARAIEENVADGFWGTAMRAEYAVSHDLASVLVDVRRGDGPGAARRFTFPALAVADRLIEQHPEAAAGAIRAIVKTQRALTADPSLAKKAAARLFPAEEADLLTGLIAQDVPYYQATISEDAIAGAADFARAAGLITQPIRYEDVVATQFRDLWTA